METILHMFLAMLCMSSGLNQGWSSPMIQILETDESPVGKLDNTQIGTLQSIPQFAGIAGVTLVVITLIRFGTKTSGRLQGIFSFTGWLLVIFANNLPMLLFGRFFTSMTNIGVDVVASFYLSEIADDCRRGAIIAFALFAITVGSLSATALGVVCYNYKLYNSLCIVPCMIFLLLCHWIPESPSHLIRTGKTEEACQSYIWFHGVSIDSGQRYVRRMQAFKRTKFRPNVVLEEKSNRRAVLIMGFMIAFPNLCGTSVISSYTSKIFEIAKVDMKPNQSALLLACIAFLSGLAGALLIERAGRRILVISSFIAMALGLYAVTAYFIMEDGELIHKNPPQWLIFAGMGCFSCGYTIGVNAVAQTMGAELVPAGVKGVVWMFAGIGGLITSVLTVQLYTLITNHMPYYVNFLQEAVFATAAVVIAWFLIPETKGKSLAHITAELKGERYDPESEEH
uniref:Sugar transporter ERD6-like 12 n=1 Tax=Lygus hesperus TaxID=30085 RepID=A0A146KZ16_LYGHE